MEAEATNVRQPKSGRAAELVPRYKLGLSPELSTSIVIDLLKGFARKVPSASFGSFKAANPLAVVEVFGVQYAIEGTLWSAFLYPIKRGKAHDAAALHLAQGKIYRWNQARWKIDGEPLGDAYGGDLRFVMPWDSEAPARRTRADIAADKADKDQRIASLRDRVVGDRVARARANAVHVPRFLGEAKS